MPDARSCRCWRRLPDYIRVAATGGGCQTTSESRGWRRLPLATISESPRLAAAARLYPSRRGWRRLPNYIRVVRLAAAAKLHPSRAAGGGCQTNYIRVAAAGGGCQTRDASEAVAGNGPARPMSAIAVAQCASAYWWGRPVIAAGAPASS